MLKRTIHIGNPAYLRLKQQQLKIRNAETQQEVGSIPIEDMALLMLDNAQITLTSQLLETLMRHTVAVVNCDAQHHPNGLMLPLQGHSELTQRWHSQIAASLPLKKQLWQQTVAAKIRNQANLLAQRGEEYQPMENYLKQIKSGDSGNMEGTAAIHYWKHYLPDFTRDRNGEAPNHLLNWGYIVLRSMVARALVSTGLLPALGIFHQNKYNPYCLADDIMEPYRPFVDKRVLDWWPNNSADTLELTVEVKQHLLGLLTMDVIIEDKTRPLMVALSTTTASLWHCFTGEKRHLAYPVMPTQA